MKQLLLHINCGGVIKVEVEPSPIRTVWWCQRCGEEYNRMVMKWGEWCEEGQCESI